MNVVGPGTDVERHEALRLIICLAMADSELTLLLADIALQRVDRFDSDRPGSLQADSKRGFWWATTCTLVP